MFDDYHDLVYDPIYEIKDYKGSYPIVQLKKVRKYLINNLKKDINSKIELEIKRKCAIFTKDLIDYMLVGKKPEKFDEKKTFQIDYQQNPFLHKILNIDDEDLIVCNENQQNASKIELSLPEATKTPNNFYEKTKRLSSEDNDNDSLLKKELSLNHGCDKWCYRNITSKDKITEKEKENLVFICDYCHFDTDNETIIKKHLFEKEHGSASQFLCEPKSKDQSSNESKISFYDEYLKSTIESKRKIIFIIDRCCLKNKITREFYNFEVFCPKCHCHFDDNILAACLHFKSLHSATQTEEVYSIGELVRTKTFEINKVHTCPTCTVKFKKLSDLALHLKNSEHFPGSLKNEINILFCPFDKCGFKSNKFFAFKNHLMSHPFFNNPKIGKFSSVQVKVGIYSSPKFYLHMAKNLVITNADKKNELEAIDELIKLNHSEDSNNLASLKKKRNILNH